MRLAETPAAKSFFRLSGLQPAALICASVNGVAALICAGVKPAFANSASVKPAAFNAWALHPAYCLINVALTPAAFSLFSASTSQPAFFMSSGVIPGEAQPQRPLYRRQKNLPWPNHLA